MRVSDERLKAIADFILTKENGFGWNFEEFQAIARELVELREKYAERVIEAFHERAELSPSAGGWHRTDGTSSNCADGDELVAMGLYEKDEGWGTGRVRKYRPIKKEPPHA